MKTLILEKKSVIEIKLINIQFFIGNILYLYKDTTFFTSVTFFQAVPRNKHE